MVIGSARIYLYADWVHSLKEKRMIVKSIIERVKHKYNVSIAEIENQDYHQSIALGIVCVSNETKHADSIIENVLAFIENNTDALVENIEKEII